MTVADDLATLRDPFGRTTFEQRTLAANRLEDEIAQLQERANFADAYKYRERAEAAAAREARLRDGLRAIADRVYPATYIGEAKDGTKMYGGSDDASRFARSLLDESDAT